MTLNPPITELADEHDFAGILKRFISLNDARLARTRDALRPRQRDFLDLLPLFFHINHPLLPGYNAKDCPAGVFGYAPDTAAMEAVTRLGRAFHFSRHVHRHLTIQAIYLMGSPGSVAYSGDSDFDVWLCHAPALDERQLRSLRDKAEAVQSWAAGLDLKVHIFLVHPDQFRRGETEALSDESSGSAQQRLLLDEFYRTSLRVAGMYPIWWLVPPDQEVAYDHYVEEIRHQRYLHARDLIDFGGLGHVPAEEFLGAAVWQLYKGIDSPYKSVLKLLLLECYAREYPYLDLLSMRFKHAVYHGHVDPDRLDPYLMMLDKVEEYLKGRGESERLNLARRCFYFKVDENLSDDEPAAARWRRGLLGRRAREWGWSRAELFVLDSRHTWKVDKITEERRVLFEALSESYRFLSGFARRYAGSALISQRDLNILGRKLYSAFERKAGKVDLLGRGFATNLVERQLTVHEVIDDTQGLSSWVLFQGAVRPEDAFEHTPVKRFRYVTEMVAWCYFNRVIDKSTHVVVFARQSRLTTGELKAMIGRMHAVFPDRASAFGGVSDFAEPAQVVHTTLFINAGLDPLARSEHAEGRIASGRSDALSYGGLGENLVHTVDQVVVTTWQEVLTYHFSGAKGLMDCLCEYLKWVPLSSGRAPVVPTVASYSPTKGNAIARRAEALFREVIDCYYTGRQPAATRYVVQVEHGFFVLSFDGDLPHYQILDNQSALLRYLGAPQKEFSPVVFDSHVQADKVLPLVFSYNRPGIVQLFYRVQGAQVDVYVLDERGSLFYRRSPFHDADALLGQYSHFFEAVLNRVKFQMQDGRSVSGAEGLEFFQVDNDNGGRLRVVRQRPRFSPSGDQFISLQVIVDVDELSRTTFSIYCNGREFCSPESGGKTLDEVANYMLELRRGRQAYPIYITDISMSPAVLGEEGVGRIQTIHFLSYKHRIEEKLNQSLKS
jgi:adenylate cyclase class 1